MDDTNRPLLPEDPAKPDEADAPAHHRDPREAQAIDPGSGMSDDPRVDSTPDRRQSTE